MKSKTQLQLIGLLAYTMLLIGFTGVLIASKRFYNDINNSDAQYSSVIIPSSEIIILVTAFAITLCAILLVNFTLRQNVKHIANVKQKSIYTNMIGTTIAGLTCAAITPLIFLPAAGALLFAGKALLLTKSANNKSLPALSVIRTVNIFTFGITIVSLFIIFFSESAI